MSMNNEARNLRLSILLFFQPSARLASTRQSGPHTRVDYRSSGTCVHELSLARARRYVRTHTHVMSVRMGTSYARVSKTKLAPGERELLRSRRRDRCIDTGNGAIHDEKKAEKLAAVSADIYVYAYVYTPRW